MKRILCITENLGSGGAERQLTGLAVLLKQAGYEVKFITYIKRQFYEDYLTQNKVNYELIVKAGNRYTRVFYLASVINKFNPDVVISFLPSTSMSVCLTKLLGLKFKLIVSERSHTSEITMRTRIKFLLYRLADSIVTNSYSEANFTSNHFPSTTNRLHTITNFIDTNRFIPVQHKVKNDTTVILSVGRIIPCKNIINYIKAIRQLVDNGLEIDVKWVGDIVDKNYYKECLDEINKLSLKSYFEFFPPVKDIENEYHKADIFCLPSFYEGFPNVICEAMGCGLPIVCSDVCDNSRIVKENINGFLFEPNDPEDIAKTLTLCLNSDFETLGHNSRDEALLNFSQEAFLHEYELLINSHSSFLRNGWFFKFLYYL